MKLQEIKNSLQSTDESARFSIEKKLQNLKNTAEERIKSSAKELNYHVREWSIEMILAKYQNGLEHGENELFIPEYQREFKWNSKIYSRFIESVLLSFPIPYFYIADIENDDDILDARVEIIDGSQRLRALHQFVNNSKPLTELKEIEELEGFYFEDLKAGRQRRFLRETLRFVELKGGVPEDVRRDLFERINSGNVGLNAAESRHGSQNAQSKFYKKLIQPCSEDGLFRELAPFSPTKVANYDHRELTLRFFAYLSDLDSYNGRLRPFIDGYLEKSTTLKAKDLTEMKREFDRTMNFVKKNIPRGFKKLPGSRSTSNTRFEALAVGTALALREDQNLTPNSPVADWIESDEFTKIVSSDAANNTQQLLRRIEYVRTKLRGSK